MQPEKYCTIYIVRHGETEHNVNDIVQGQPTDSALTELGREQVKNLSEELKNIHFEAVFSSDLSRAKATAELVLIDRQLAINTTKLLRERHYGSFEATPVSLYTQQKKLIMERQKVVTEDQKKNFKAEDAYESNQEIASRMLAFLRETAVAFIGKTVLVVSHGAIMSALLAHLGEFGFVGNAGYIKLETDGVDFFVKETKGVNKEAVIK